MANAAAAAAVLASRSRAARAALAELIAAAESGEPAAEALSRLPEAPEALAPLAEGIAPLPILQAEFAPAARAALAARPIAPDASLGERVTAFFSSQTGARSLAPREGNDVDAVLSRAEAQLRAGDLTGTLAELDLLDILSSDYVPAALLLAAVQLGEIWGDMARGLATVTQAPARAVGLEDRGRLEPGLRADLIRFRLRDGVPALAGVWARGARVA